MGDRANAVTPFGGSLTVLLTATYVELVDLAGTRWVASTIASMILDRTGVALRPLGTVEVGFVEGGELFESSRGEGRSATRPGHRGGAWFRPFPTWSARAGASWGKP
ncbi:hypothetical protein ACFYOT_34985 [Saccharothrix saharensis]|uniref:hypothetical protein n=1 Tax=Saccharothrix saharensis TaxID=571190 RepID=UPI00369B14F3